MTPPIDRRDRPEPIPPRPPVPRGEPGGRPPPVERPRPDTYVREEPIAYLLQEDGQGNIQATPLYARDIAALLKQGSSVVPEDYPLNPETIQNLLFPHETTPQTATQQSATPLWVRIPQGEGAREIVSAVLRMLSPNGAANQDGLRAMLQSGQFAQLFRGGQMPQGAAQMMPAENLIGILLPPGILAMNPAAAKSLLVAQGLPPQLIQNIPDQALAGALHALLAAGQGTAQNPLQFLQAVMGLFSLAGIPQQQVQAILASLASQVGQQGIRGELNAATLSQLAGRLLATNNPQLLGLNQMVQSNFGQGISQILNSFIRVFMGGALMQGQAMWPQAVPNERMLAELGGLFGRRQMQDDWRKEKKRRRPSRRRSGKVEELDREIPGRIRGKADLADREARQAPMESVFIQLDDDQ